LEKRTRDQHAPGLAQLGAWRAFHLWKNPSRLCRLLIEQGYGTVRKRHESHDHRSRQHRLLLGSEPGCRQTKRYQLGTKSCESRGARDQAWSQGSSLAHRRCGQGPIWFAAIKGFVVAHRSALSGKIVVEPSNPIAPDGKGGLKKTIPADQSSGVIIAGLLSESTELVKAFGTLGAESLGSGGNRKPEPAVLSHATDYPEAGRAVAKLISVSGFALVSVGGIDQSIRIEVGGDLHEFGKLGRLTTASEETLLV
jgi:8-hydroxy-5-deazaflavin:NADPH oxidoreductase